MLNHLTLHISNEEVAKNVQIHRAMQLDRLILGGILTTTSYLINSIVAAKINKNGSWIEVLNEVIVLLTLVSYRLFRIFFKAQTSLHEYIVVGIFTMEVILCTLCNTNRLPSSLNGPDVEAFRSLFERDFYIFAVLQLVSLKKVVFVMSPLYLLAQFFRWKQ